MKVEFACTWRWNVAQLSSVCMCSCNMHVWSIVQTCRVSLSLQSCQRLLTCMRTTLWTYITSAIQQVQPYVEQLLALRSCAVELGVEVRTRFSRSWERGLDPPSQRIPTCRVTSLPMCAMKCHKTIYIYIYTHTYIRKSFAICDAKTMPFQCLLRVWCQETTINGPNKW